MDCAQESAQLLPLQRLSRGEQRQGSVGGARRGIGQIETGASATVVALAAAPPRASWASREGDRGIEGDLAAYPETLSAHCVAARGQSRFGIHFAARVNIPLDPPPIPRRDRARGRGKARDYRRGGPPMERRGSGLGGREEPARWAWNQLGDSRVVRISSESVLWTSCFAGQRRARSDRSRSSTLEVGKRML